MIETSMKLKNEFPKLYDAALKEFASYSYDNASLNRILKDAKISKGSFYHNIGDKYSLYLMLMSCIAYRKIEMFKNNVLNNCLPDNFFDKLKFISITNCNFVFSEPLMNKLFIQYTKESPEFLDKLYQSVHQDDKQIWTTMIEDGINRGDIRNDIPRNIAIAFIDSSIKGLSTLMSDGMTPENYKDSVIEYIEVIKRALT